MRKPGQRARCAMSGKNNYARVSDGFKRLVIERGRVWINGTERKSIPEIISAWAIPERSENWRGWIEVRGGEVARSWTDKQWEIAKYIETRVRVGEWNEALCINYPDRPRTEIVAQRTDAHNFFVYYVTSRTALTIAHRETMQEAEKLARYLAPLVLNAERPRDAAYRYQEVKGMPR